MEELAPPLPDENKHEGKRPFGLLKPRGGHADDLKRVSGIGPQNEGRLHALGIWHFDQIARWTHDNVLWVGSYLAFPGRIDREKWIDQAKVLASGADTEFSKRAAAGLVPTSKDNGSKGQGNVGKVGPTDETKR
jgi:predicted flap endonuclease-1-like 5' DNA nuclease